MDEKKISLPLVGEALTEMNNQIVALENAIELAHKKVMQESEAQLLVAAEKDKEIASLKESSIKALQGMESVINKLDSVLEQNGAGNNNN